MVARAANSTLVRDMESRMKGRITSRLWLYQWVMACPTARLDRINAPLRVCRDGATGLAALK
jgi:hypothetical protein